MKNIITAILCCLSFVFTQAQTYYFVDGTNGNDANNGTGLATAWKTIQNAFDKATAGSVVFIKAGTYKQQLTLNVSGTALSPIEFRNYQTDSVYIDGTGLPSNPMIDITDKSNIVFRNLIVQNLVTNNAIGVQIICSGTGTVNNIAFKKVMIRNISWTSNASTKPTSSKNSQPFIAYGQGTTAAHAMTNILVDSCTLYNNITGFSESLSFGGNISAVVITNNLVHDNTNIGIDVTGNYNECQCGDTAIDHTRNVLIAKNNCYNNVSNYATSGGIYVDGAANVIVEKNITHNNGYGIELGCEQNGSSYNLIVRDNLIYNNQVTGMAIGGYDVSTTGIVVNALITNNTFIANNYANDGSGEIDITKVSGCLIKQNIFYTNAQNMLFTKEAILPQINLLFDYNDWFTPGNDSTSISVNWGSGSLNGYSSYKTTTGFDAHSLYTDPLLISASVTAPNGHLMATSPCINKGDVAFVIGNNETDFDGKARVVNSIIDIGAYEYAPSSVPVGLLYFKAVKEQGAVMLSWTTVNEVDNNYFEVERSKDGQHFVAIHKQAGLNSLQQNNYQFVDEHPNTTINYYRLKQVDFDGSVTYSKLVKTEAASAGKFIVSPKVINHQLSVINNGAKTIGLLYSTSGQLYKSFDITAGQNELWIPALSGGIYYMRIEDKIFQLFNSVLK